MVPDVHERKGLGTHAPPPFHFNPLGGAGGAGVMRRGEMDLQGCLDLVAAVLRPVAGDVDHRQLDYLRGPCGRLWMGLAGLDARRAIHMLAQAVNVSPWGPLYLRQCPGCKGVRD